VLNNVTAKKHVDIVRFNVEKTFVAKLICIC